MLSSARSLKICLAQHLQEILAGLAIRQSPRRALQSRPAGET
jgi:hypothetical protein